MTERDFIYWLKGYLEMSDATTLDERQVKIINDHIKLVVNKVTPQYFQSPLTTITPFNPIIDTQTVIC